MFGGRTEYDHGVNTFSPEGRIFQIEYARKAANLGSAGIGICIKDGVVLAVERRISSPLIVASSIEKIFEIDHHVAAVVSGMTADAKSLVEYARVEAQNHRFTYNEPIPVEAVTLSVCDLSLRFGEGGSKKKKVHVETIRSCTPSCGDRHSRRSALGHRPERYILAL